MTGSANLSDYRRDNQLVEGPGALLSYWGAGGGTESMTTGLCCILLGVLIFFYPQILIAMLSTLLILFGLGLMATAWQFRRLQRRSESRFINWIIRW